MASTNGGNKAVRKNIVPKDTSSKRVKGSLRDDNQCSSWKLLENSPPSKYDALKSVAKTTSEGIKTHCLAELEATVFPKLDKYGLGFAKSVIETLVTMAPHEGAGADTVKEMADKLPLDKLAVAIFLITDDITETAKDIYLGTVEKRVRKVNEEFVATHDVSLGVSAAIGEATYDCFVETAEAVSKGTGAGPEQMAEAVHKGMHVPSKLTARVLVTAEIINETREEEIADYLKRMDSPAMVAFDEGWKSYNNGDLKQAVKSYDEAIRIDPEFAAAFNGRGLAQAGLGYMDNAIEDYCMAIEINPDFVDAFNNRGKAYANKGSLDKTLEDYDNAIKDFEKAIGIYAKEVEQTPNSVRLRLAYAEAFDNLGEAYAAKASSGHVIYDEIGGLLNKAVENYDKAIGIDPNSISAHYNRDRAMSALKRRKRRENDC